MAQIIQVPKAEAMKIISDVNKDVDLTIKEAKARGAKSTEGFTFNENGTPVSILNG